MKKGFRWFLVAVTAYAIIERPEMVKQAVKVVLESIREAQQLKKLERVKNEG